MIIKLEQFEGPLALLVKLIDKAELDITQVSLATVTDQYLQYLKTLENLNPEETADFLVVASRLLLIKAKALLPYLLPEEEEAIEDFESQLRMYKEFLEATKQIEKMVAGKKFMFAREFNRKSLLANVQMFSPPKKLTKEGMAEIMRDFISNLKKPEAPLPERVMGPTVSLEEKISQIKATITKLVRSRFSDFLTGAKSKVDVVVSFLAMLELVKQRTIQAEQGELFEEIELSKI